MRGLKSTIALLVVLAGLGAYIYFVTWKRPEDTGTKQEKVFASLEADKIDEIKVKSESGDTTTLKKENGAWLITAPMATKADESEVTAVTSGLGTLEMTRVVDENPTDLKEYGLTTPRVEVDFKAAGDKDYRRVQIGEKSPTGSDFFAKRNDEKRVFLIPSYQEGSLNHGTFDFRDKAVLKFDRDKVDGIEVVAAGKTLQMAKEASDWKIAKPIQARADYGATEGLIGRLQSVQMKSIVSNDPSPADLKKYGLDKPAATATLSAGSARATLVLGGKADDTTVYARDTSKPIVMTVESSLADDLKKGADDYRRKDVFEFRPYSANRIELTRDGQTFAFEKTKGQGDNAPDKWRRLSPNAADVDRNKVDAFLTKLSNMRASSFVDSTAKTGLDKPALAVSAKFDDGKKEERVTFGKADKDVYVGRGGEPGAAKVDATELDDALKALDEISK
jgi:hypothetical protein